MDKFKPHAKKRKKNHMTMNRTRVENGFLGTAMAK